MFDVDLNDMEIEGLKRRIDAIAESGEPEYSELREYVNTLCNQRFNRGMSKGKTVLRESLLDMLLGVMRGL